MLEKNLIENVQFSDSPVKEMVVGSENFKVMRICLKAGASIPPHQGSHAVFFLILKGRGIFITDKGEIELKQHEFLYLKRDETRGITCLEDLIVLGVRD